MSIIREFREFAIKGNVVDLAVAVVIGAAFGKIVSSLVNDVVMPPVGMLLGNVDFSQLAYTLKEATAETEAVKINYGLFINNVLDFVIVAFVIFLVIKQMNRLKAPPPTPTATTKECPQCLMTIPLKATRCGHCTAQIAG
jgi:large conductance mechanosensitive channel